VPKRALKMMGLKTVTNEAGESEIVEREGAQPREVDWSQVARVSVCVCVRLSGVTRVINIFVATCDACTAPRP